MKQSPFYKIHVPVPHWTSAAKAGVTRLLVSHGRKGMVLGNLFAPDHDAPVFESVVEHVSQYRPEWIILLGRMFHDHAFELVAPGEATRNAAEDEPPLAQEVEAARALTEVWEERVVELGRLLGQNYLVRLVEAAGPQCKLFYIPALEGNRVKLPPESNIPDILKRIQGSVDAYRRATLGENYDPANYPTLPMKRGEFAKLLGVDKHPQIFVLPFGSTIMLNCLVPNAPTAPDPANTKSMDAYLKKYVGNKVRVEIGKRSTMHPITEGYNGAMLGAVSTITSYPPHHANGWWTKWISANITSRIYLSFAQVGMMFARHRLDFGDGHLERYATGFWCGYNWRGALHGKSFPFVRGTNGCRFAQLWGHTLQEREPGDMGRQDVFVL